MVLIEDVKLNPCHFWSPTQPELHRFVHEKTCYQTRYYLVSPISVGNIPTLVEFSRRWEQHSFPPNRRDDDSAVFHLRLSCLASAFGSIHAWCLYCYWCLFFSTCLCFESVKVCFHLTSYCFLVVHSYFFGRKQLNSSFNPCWCFLVPSNICGVFVGCQLFSHPRYPGANQRLGLSMQWPLGKPKKWAQGITSYGEVVVGPVITLAILPKEAIYRGPIILQFMTSNRHIMQVLSNEIV